MAAKVYIIIDVHRAVCHQVARILRCQPGVVMADALEDQSQVMLVVAAKGWPELAELTNRALGQIERQTDGIHLLPTSRDNPSVGSRRHPPALRSRVACQV